MTLPAMGAEPVTMSLQRPPRMAFVFLKMILSQSQCVYLSHVTRARNWAAGGRGVGAEGHALALGEAGNFGSDGFADEPGLAALGRNQRQTAEQPRRGARGDI